MMDINVDLLQWFINFFDKKSSATHKGAGVNSENQHLPE